MKVAYFGCQTSGHFLFGPWWGNSERLLVGGEARHLDSGFLDRGGSQTEGHATLTHTDAGFTVLSFWDRSVDQRGGSHSTFVLSERVGFDRAVSESQAAWPEVWGRFSFEVKKNGHTMSTR